MYSSTSKFWSTVFLGIAAGFASLTEPHASGAAETQAVKAAEQYVQSMLTTCGDSSFVTEAPIVRQFQGPVTANGCRELPTQASGAAGAAWSCSVQFKATRERIYTPGVGWSSWGKQPPLLIMVQWPEPASQSASGQLTKLACSDVPKQTEPEQVKETPEQVKSTPAPAKKETPTTSAGQRSRVNSPGDGFLALRSEPSVSAGARLAKIPHGTPIELGNCTPNTSGSGNWCRANYGGQSGWVLDRYIAK